MRDTFEQQKGVAMRNRLLFTLLLAELLTVYDTDQTTTCGIW
jgi:hypothetical protein